MPLKLYNSLSQKKEDFKPIDDKHVRMYVCGVTVYDECHLGHARAAVVFDVIYRYLKYLGYDVTYIRNFTDIDDKIIKKSNETGEDWVALTKRYIDSYQDVMGRLGVASPDKEPLATEHIPHMLELIQSLEAKGLAYKSGEDVFYAVRNLPDYGKLSHKKIDDLEIGARIDVNEKKKDPLDFVLWKRAKPGEPKWESPWGEGRPGWHIECSAMSMEYLGESFDIHGGGRDLIFPHHENEIAQSEGATGKPFAKYWIHNGFVNINAEKMSKSLGNIRTMHAILEQWDPEVVRYFLLSAKYGSPIDFTDTIINGAQVTLTRFYEMMDRLEKTPRGDWTFPHEWEEKLQNALDDDFNTPLAMARIFEAVRQINTKLDEGKNPSDAAIKSIKAGVAHYHEVLGLFGSTDFLERTRMKKLAEHNVEEKQVLDLIAERAEARSKKDWAAADAVRDQLGTLGIELQDNPDGKTTWTVSTSS